MRCGKTPNDRLENCRGGGIGAAYSELAGRRVGQKLDVSYALLQFIECDQAASQQGLAINSWHDAPAGTIEKTHAQCVLQIANRLGDRSLGDMKVLGGLCHTSPSYDGEIRVQIAEPQTPANLIIPIDRLRHIQLVIPQEQNQEYPLSHDWLNISAPTPLVDSRMRKLPFVLADFGAQANPDLIRSYRYDDDQAMSRMLRHRPKGGDETSPVRSTHPALQAMPALRWHG